MHCEFCSLSIVAALKFLLLIFFAMKVSSALFYAGVVLLSVIIAFEMRYFDSESLDPGPFALMALNFALVTALRYTADILMKPSHKALEDAMGSWRAEVQYACVKAGIPEHLSIEPKTLAELADLTGATSKHNLLRLLRAAESIGYFREDSAKPESRWHNTRLSSVLVSSHPLSVAHLVRHWKEDTESAWSHLYEAMILDRNVYKDTHDGQTLWQVLATNPVQEAQFQGAMRNQDALYSVAVATDFNWGKYHRVIDFGGGTGAQLAQILLHHPQISSGVLFDQPQVVNHAASVVWTESGDVVKHTLRSKVSFVAGDFFDASSLPVIQQNDAILLRTVLHDWSHTDALHILQTLRAVIADTPNVVVVLADLLLQKKDPLGSAKFFVDLHMKVSFHDAQERYEEEWQALVSAAGFQVRHIVQPRAVSHLLVLAPV